MIKRLRAKFICVIMIIVATLLLAIFALICRNTWVQMEAASLSALRAAMMEPARPGKPGGMDAQLSQPCFVLRMDRTGRLEALGSGHYDLTDEALLLEIYQQAQATELEKGILHQWKLRFYRMDMGPGGYAFMDISTQLDAMQTLVINCLFIGSAALAAFFVAAYLLSRWLVKPVEEAWDAQRQFVGDASHELKTPLTVILTNAELLQSEEYDPHTKARFAASIYTMSCQMRGLVESLLQLARLDQGTGDQKMGAVDLSALVEECVLPFEAVYFEAGRTLDSQIEPGFFTLGDPQQLRQVVDILLDNGRKYATAGSSVELRLTAQGHGHCLLQVASRGEPLTNQQCKDIFKRFYQTDAARSRNGSYGLGLSIAHSIVSQHRGRIWCQSRDGINTFFVSLPVQNRSN